MKERIQKLIASSGHCSRRAAEELISQDRVRVNGNPARLGDLASPEDLIEIDGKALAPPGARTYIMLNKPRGYVTTLSDEKGRKTVADLVSGVPARLFPVGRLDMDSEGLLIMTDDGELANRLTHPSHEVEKTYSVRVSGEDIPSALKLLRSAMVIDGSPITPAKALLKSEATDTALLAITIKEGRNRQIRKMCKQANLTVLSLKRISEGPLKLENLPTGKWRYLQPEETEGLQKL